MPAGRNQPSSIDLLPEPIREELNRLRVKESWGIDSLVSWLMDQGHEVSRSAMGRHCRSLFVSTESAAERLHQSSEIAKALVDRFGDREDNELARLNIQILHGQVFNAIMNEEQEDEEGNPLPGDPLKLVRLSKAVQQLLSAEKMNAERIAQIRKEAMELATKEAAEKATDAARAAGLSKDGVAAIRYAVLGA